MTKACDAIMLCLTVRCLTCSLMSSSPVAPHRWMLQFELCAFLKSCHYLEDLHMWKMPFEVARPHSKQMQLCLKKHCHCRPKSIAMYPLLQVLDGAVDVSFPGGGLRVRPTIISREKYVSKARHRSSYSLKAIAYWTILSGTPMCYSRTAGNLQSTVYFLI